MKLLIALSLFAMPAFSEEATVNISANFKQIGVVHEISGTVSGTQITSDKEPKQVILTPHKVTVIYY